MNPPPILTFEGVTFRYPGAGRPTIRDLSFAVPAGGFVGIRGASGSGKSTLLRLACRLDTPEAGDVRFDDRPVDRWEPCLLRRQAALVQQVPAMVDGSVGDNLRLAFGFRANGDVSAPDDGRLAEMLTAFELDRVGLDHDAEKLSVGQKQRLAILRAMLLEPRLLMLDEPTSALDPDNARRVIDMLVALNRESGVTVLLVTHREEDEQHLTDTVWLEAI